MSTDIDTEHPTRHPVHIRILFGVVVAALGVFIVCTALYNLPDSTVKQRVRPAVDAVMHPWLEQDWQLFAPTPSTSNTHLQVTTRVRVADGSIRELPAFDVQYPIEDLPKSDHVLPTKRPGVTLAAQERMANYSRQLAVISRAPAAAQPKLHAELDDRYRTTLDELDRFMSRCAQDRFGTAGVLAVRGTFTTTPMTPFSARHVHDPEPLPTTTIVTTSWDPFVANVSE